MPEAELKFQIEQRLHGFEVEVYRTRMQPSSVLAYRMEPDEPDEISTQYNIQISRENTGVTRRISALHLNNRHVDMLDNEVCGLLKIWVIQRFYILPGDRPDTGENG